MSDELRVGIYGPVGLAPAHVKPVQWEAEVFVEKLAAKHPEAIVVSDALGQVNVWAMRHALKRGLRVASFEHVKCPPSRFLPGEFAATIVPGAYRVIVNELLPENETHRMMLHCSTPREVPHSRVRGRSNAIEMARSWGVANCDQVVSFYEDEPGVQVHELAHEHGKELHVLTAKVLVSAA